MKCWILAALVAVFVAVPVSASAQQADQTSGRSLAYRIEFDDVRDRLVHYELFPGLVYFGRGITLGFGVGVDLQLLSWLQLQLYGQGAYTGFIADPNGPLLAEAVLALGGPSVEKKPTAVELTRSSDFQRLNSTQGLVTTYTQNLSGVPLSERTRSPFRLGVRLLRGSTDPAAPTNRDAAEKRVDATILWGFLGFGIELANNWKVVVEEFGQRASRSVLKFGMDIMYAPVRDYAEDVADARDDFLFPLGTRMVMQLGSVAPLGISTRFEMGLNGAGAGWYAMLGVGVSGSAVPIGDEK